ncbi:MAG: Stp1/IreP family PP2C-type Ser/Thr phosphatase [Acidobacteriota bacterium]
MASDNSQPPQGIQIDVFGLTDVGRVRKNNQDYFALVDLSRKNQGTGPEVTSHALGTGGTLILVSDGMGGEAAGDVASRRSVETVVEEMIRWSRADAQGDVGLAFANALDQAVQKANEVVSRESDENPAYRGMGATMTAAGVLDGELFVVQVGDSRCYLHASGVLRQITRDQSLVGQLLVEGRITKEEAERHPHRNIILQALGKSPTIQAEVLRLPLRRGDEILLCSDGLSGPVRDHDIDARLNAGGDLAEICRDLVQTANDHGGSDNITAVVARFLGEGLQLPKEDESRAPGRLAEFSFTGEEEEETQETPTAPDQTAFLGEAEMASIAEILSSAAPPPPPDIPEPIAPPLPPSMPVAPPPPSAPAGVAVSGLSMMTVLAFSVAAGLALTRLLGPEPARSAPAALLPPAASQPPAAVPPAPVPSATAPPASPEASPGASSEGMPSADAAVAPADQTAAAPPESAAPENVAAAAETAGAQPPASPTATP